MQAAVQSGCLYVIHAAAVAVLLAYTHVYVFSQGVACVQLCRFPGFTAQCLAVQHEATDASTKQWQLQ
jgi:hypothetical protein